MQENLITELRREQNSSQVVCDLLARQQVTRGDRIQTLQDASPEHFIIK